MHKQDSDWRNMSTLVLKIPWWVILCKSLNAFEQTLKIYCSKYIVLRFEKCVSNNWTITNVIERSKMWKSFWPRTIYSCLYMYTCTPVSITLQNFKIQRIVWFQLDQITIINFSNILQIYKQTYRVKFILSRLDTSTDWSKVTSKQQASSIKTMEKLKSEPRSMESFFRGAKPGYKWAPAKSCKPERSIRKPSPFAIGQNYNLPSPFYTGQNPMLKRTLQNVQLIYIFYVFEWILLSFRTKIQNVDILIKFDIM